MSKLRSAELVVRCAGCGHCAPLSERMMSANKTLVCSRCGTRQRLRLGQIIEAAYREFEQTRKAAKAKKPDPPREPEPPRRERSARAKTEKPKALVARHGGDTLH